MHPFGALFCFSSKFVEDKEVLLRLFHSVHKLQVMSNRKEREKELDHTRRKTLSVMLTHQVSKVILSNMSFRK